MKTIRHTARMSQPLHIEAPGCIINVRAGLGADEGQPVTVVQVICDKYPGEVWTLEDGGMDKKFATLRIIKQPYAPA